MSDTTLFRMTLCLSQNKILLFLLDFSKDPFAFSDKIFNMAFNPWVFCWSDGNNLI